MKKMVLFLVLLPLAVVMAGDRQSLLAKYVTAYNQKDSLNVKIKMASFVTGETSFFKDTVIHVKEDEKYLGNALRRMTIILTVTVDSSSLLKKNCWVSDDYVSFSYTDNQIGNPGQKVIAFQTAQGCQTALAYSRGVNAKNWLVKNGNFTSSIFISRNYKVTQRENSVYLWDVGVEKDIMVIDAYENYNGYLLVIYSPASGSMVFDPPIIVDKNPFDGVSKPSEKNSSDDDISDLPIKKNTENNRTSHQ